MSRAAVDVVREIATPSRLAMLVAPDFIAEQYQVDPWLKVLEEEVLHAWGRKGKQGLIINVPPQCGKSSYTGLWFPAWVLGMKKTERVIFVTYSETYSRNWTRKVRDLLKRYGQDLFGVEVKADVAAADEWEMEGSQGGMKAVGILGGITGRSGNIVIVEDVIRTIEEANSETVLTKQWDEFNGAIIPRVQEDGLIIVIATRYTQGDISGRLLEGQEGHEEGESFYVDVEGVEEGTDIEWRSLNFQAIAQPPRGVDNSDGSWRDPLLGRPEGEALKTRHGPKHFHGMKRHYARHNPLQWAALFQGDPSAPENSGFPDEAWLWYDPDDEDFMAEVYGRIRVWDLAASKGKGDYTVSELWGKHDEHMVVLDVDRFRTAGAGVRARVQTTAQLDGQGVPIYMEQEKAGSGKGLIDIYKADMPDYLLTGLVPDGTKDTRIAWYAQVQNRKTIYLPTTAHWLDRWLKEHSAYTSDGRLPRYDDQLDAGAYAVLTLWGGGDTYGSFPGSDEGDLTLETLGDLELVGHYPDPSAGMLGGFLR